MSDMETRFNEAKALYEKWRYAEAVPLLQALANEGYAEAQCKIGWCYYYAQGVEKDYAKAIEWYTKAAEQGYAEAQYILANCYESGEGIEKDRGKAIEWYRKAANQGHSIAQRALRPIETPFKAEQGDAYAQWELALQYYDGRGVDQDYTKAFEWWTKSAEQGFRGAQYRLGCCYYKGEGVEKDEVKAVECFSKDGSPEAKEWLKKIAIEAGQNNSEAMDSSETLTWKDFDKIALALRKKHWDISPVPLKREDIRKKALGLESFKDVETPDEFYLRAIQSKWIHLMHEGEAPPDPREVCP